jgi:hypothetical protein
MNPQSFKKHRCSPACWNGLCPKSYHRKLGCNGEMQLAFIHQGRSGFL